MDECKYKLSDVPTGTRVRVIACGNARTTLEPLGVAPGVTVTVAGRCGADMLLTVNGILLFAEMGAAACVTVIKVASGKNQ